jgi:hypothetical protein
MKDAFERRALLLHLGAVLDAMDKVLSHAGDQVKVTVRELLSAHRSLAKLPVLTHVPGDMTAYEFATRVSGAFASWPAELLEAELNRERLAAAVRNALFAAHDDGWRAYAASVKREVSWFGDGLTPPHAESDNSIEQKSRAREAEKPRHTQHEDEATGHGGVYPSWPWKPKP